MQITKLLTSRVPGRELHKPDWAENGPLPYQSYNSSSTCIHTWAALQRLASVVCL